MCEPIWHRGILSLYDRSARVSLLIIIPYYFAPKVCLLIYISSFCLPVWFLYFFFSFGFIAYSLGLVTKRRYKGIPPFFSSDSDSLIYAGSMINNCQRVIWRSQIAKICIRLCNKSCNLYVAIYFTWRIHFMIGHGAVWKLVV